MIHWFNAGLPYDLLTFLLVSVLFGIFFTWGQRVGSKLP